MVRHGQLLDRMRRFEERYEFTALRRESGAAVRRDARLAEGDRRRRDGALHRVDEVGYWITATFRPAISVPAGFTPDGLPVGIQIVGRYRDDFGVLQLGHAFEQATKVGLRRPAIGVWYDEAHATAPNSESIRRFSARSPWLFLRMRVLTGPLRSRTRTTVTVSDDRQGPGRSNSTQGSTSNTPMIGESPRHGHHHPRADRQMPVKTANASGTLSYRS